MDTQEQLDSSLLLQKNVLQLALLIVIACFQVNAFLENVGILLAVLTLTTVCLVSIAFQRNNPLGWGCLVPLYCLMMYSLIPSILYEFGVRDDYRDLDGMTEALLLVSGFVGIFSITYTLTEQVLHTICQGKAFSLLEGPPFSVLESPFSSYLLFPIVGYAFWYSYMEGYFGLYASESVSAFAGIASTAQLLLTVWFCYVAVRFWEKNQGLRFSVPLLLSFGMMFSSALLSNSKGAIIAPIIILGLSRYLSTGRFPFGLFVSAFAVLMLIAFPIVSGLRMLAVTRSQDILGDLTTIQGVFLDSGMGWDDISNSLLYIDRSLLLALSKIISSIGSDMSLMYGDTYMHGLSTFVPRVLWPDKPDMNIGNEFGHNFGFLAPGDFVTNVSPGLIGEMYMNFGVLGCFFGAVVFAMFIVFFEFFVVGYSKYGKIMFASYVLWMEGAIGHTFLPFLKGIVAVSLFLFLLMGVRQVWTVTDHEVHRGD